MQEVLYTKTTTTVETPETPANPASTDGREFAEYKRNKRLKEARAEAAKLEYPNLVPATTKAQLKELCRTADGLKLGALTVLPNLVKPCVSLLGDDPQVALIAAIDCPLGGSTTEVKAAAVKNAIRDGVDEAEVYAPMSYLEEGNFYYFKKECKKLRKASKGRALRVVIDAALLDLKCLLKSAAIAADAGVNCIFLKHAEADLISRVKAHLKGKCLIKAEAENLQGFAAAINGGADAVQSANAFALAQAILSEA